MSVMNGPTTASTWWSSTSRRHAADHAGRVPLRRPFDLLDHELDLPVDAPALVGLVEGEAQAVVPERQPGPEGPVLEDAHLERGALAGERVARSRAQQRVVGRILGAEPERLALQQVGDRQVDELLDAADHLAQDDVVALVAAVVVGPEADDRAGPADAGRSHPQSLERVLHPGGRRRLHAGQRVGNDHAVVEPERGVAVERAAAVLRLEPVEHGLEVGVALMDLVEADPPLEGRHQRVLVVVAGRAERRHRHPGHVLVAGGMPVPVVLDRGQRALHRRQRAVGGQDDDRLGPCRTDGLELWFDGSLRVEEADGVVAHDGEAVAVGGGREGGEELLADEPGLVEHADAAMALARHVTPRGRRPRPGSHRSAGRSSRDRPSRRWRRTRSSGPSSG